VAGFVYETLSKRFVLYSDLRLQTPSVIDALKTAFGLHEAKVIVMSDPSIVEHWGRKVEFKRSLRLSPPDLGRYFSCLLYGL
jgi:hypothetical protein